MSDTSQGPGWWQASDGRWYPPDAATTPTPAGGAPGTSAYGELADWGTRAIGFLIDAVLLVGVFIVGAIIAIILGASVRTVHKHVEHIFEKLGVESRNAATLAALEILRPAK